MNEFVMVKRDLLERWLKEIGESKYVMPDTSVRREELRGLLACSPEHPAAYMRNEGTPNNLVKCTFTCPGAFGVYRHPVPRQEPSAAVVLPDAQFDQVTELLETNPLELNLSAQRLLRRKRPWSGS